MSCDYCEDDDPGQVNDRGALVDMFEALLAGDLLTARALVGRNFSDGDARAIEHVLRPGRRAPQAYSGEHHV